MRPKLLLVFAGVPALIQAQAQFEVASIRPSAPMTQSANVGVHIDGAQVNCLQLSLRDYLRIAYKVKDYQLEAPDWMASARFDIVAKLPSGAKQDQVSEMVGALLADRFQMKTHRDSHEFPVYALVVGKSGSKLKASPPDAPTESADGGKSAVNVGAATANGVTSIDMGNGSFLSIGNNQLVARRLSMLVLAESLARFTDRPVVDLTQIPGNYDFTLEFSPEDFRAMTLRAAKIAGVALPPEALKMLDAAPGDTMFTALETVGLKLEPRKAPLEVVVVDHMERTPTDN